MTDDGPATGAGATGDDRFAGRRVVVVGASAGIGRAFALDAAARGAAVVVSARRGSALDDVVAAAGRSTTALRLDVADPASRSAWIDALGAGPPVDLVLVTVGTAMLQRFAETDDEAWNDLLSVNLVGIARLLSEVRPLMADHGVVVVLSSETVRRPRTGLVPYAASKAALETVIHGLRAEQPRFRVSCVSVGATFPTEFGDGFGAEELTTAMREWQRHGLTQQDFMTPEDVAGVLVDVFASALRHPGIAVEDVVLRSPSPVVGLEG